MIPAAVRLTPSFDPDRLRADLAVVSGHTWNRQQVSGYHGLGERTELDWRVLPLRSIAGDPARTDPGGPGPADFAPTPWLDLVPYLADVLGAIPGPLNAARLMALGPATASHTHSDPKYALERGFLRLHLPVTTNPGAVLTLDGQEHHWQPGELWCGQFARPHAVRNYGTTTRVHLVVDVLISTALAGLFPQPLRPALRREALFTRPAQDGATAADLAVDLPEAFTDFSRDDVLTSHVGTRPARLEVTDRTGCLTLAGGQRFALVHLGEGEYRFAAWSEQRTLRLRDDALILRTRHGRTVCELPASYRKDSPC